MADIDPVESQKLELEHLILEKKRLESEIEIMQQQKIEYEKNKDFYDKLIQFHEKI